MKKIPTHLESCYQWEQIILNPQDQGLTQDKGDFTCSSEYSNVHSTVSGFGIWMCYDAERTDHSPCISARLLLDLVMSCLFQEQRQFQWHIPAHFLFKCQTKKMEIKVPAPWENYRKIYSLRCILDTFTHPPGLVTLNSETQARVILVTIPVRKLWGQFLMGQKQTGKMYFVWNLEVKTFPS